MHIQFKMEGGVAYFPGLSKPITIESDELPVAEADELARLVNSARFFDRPRIIGAPSPGAADYRQYTITVEDGGRRHTVQVTDPVTDPNLRGLLDYLQAKAKTQRAATRSRSLDNRPDKSG